MIGIKNKSIHRIKSTVVQLSEDEVVEEAPLEIRLQYGPKENRQQKPIAITMRTPGQDVDLALGFLFTEAIIGKVEDILQVESFLDQNVVSVSLVPNLKLDIDRLGRNFYTSSSCGVCGKGSLEMVESVSCYFPKSGYPRLNVDTLWSLSKKLRDAQSIFTLTGGIHAAGLFNKAGQLQLLKEDVGRHNAVDKLIGAALQKQQLPLRDDILFLSGRIGFELVQKATMAGIPIIAAVGAPSSLAVDLAEESDMTLIGFLRNERMNVYCGMERVVT